MPTFSDLPNELVAMTWGFVDEPEDIESFALVTKRIYRISKPFVDEHERMKRLLPTISIDLETEPEGPHELLERLLHHPRLAFYIHEAQIEDWSMPGYVPNVSLDSLTPERVAEFENAVRGSFFVPPSEKEGWVRTIKEGNPDPIIALIMMRLTKLRKLRLVYPYTGGSPFLLGTLERMTCAIDGGDNSQISFKKPSPFRYIKELEINLGGIQTDILCKILQGVKRLETFAFTPGSSPTFDFRLLNRALLRCSRDSLQKLILHSDSSSQRYIGRLTGFHHLEELSLNIDFLLGHQEAQQRRLKHVLPASVRELSLYMEDTAEPDEVEDVVDQLVECKMERCPRLETVWVEMVDMVEMDEEEESQLKEKLAEVGVEFDMGEYSNF